MTSHQCEGCGFDGPLVEDCRCAADGHDVDPRARAIREALCEARADLALAQEQLQRERTMRENVNRDRASLARQLDAAEKVIARLRTMCGGQALVHFAPGFEAAQ